MGEKKHVTAEFVPGTWEFTTDGGSTFQIGKTSTPYDYLMGALSGCLFATFNDLAIKMKVEWEHVSFDVNGEKKATPPTTFEWVSIDVVAKGVSDQERFTKAFETATRYCSIYTTISKVAEMKWNIEFA